MPNFIPSLQSFARLASLGSLLGQPQQQPEPVFDIDAEIAKIYQPRNTMQNMATSMLEQFPQRDTTPSKWRRIGAVLAGMGTDNPMAASDQFLNHHYYNNLRDFKTKFDPVSKAADDERLANAQLRGLAEQTVSRKLTDLERQRKEKNDASLAKTRDAQVKINEGKLQLAQIKQSQPQWKLVTSVKGGNVYAFNPLTTELKDTGIDSGTLSDAEKIALQLESSLEQIGARGAESRKTQSEGISQRNEATKEQIGIRENNLLKRPPKTSGTNSGSPALNEQRERYNRAQEAALKPEWSKWIKLEPSNRFTVTPPKSGFFSSGPDKATHDAIVAHITGSKTASGLPNNRSTTTTAPSTKYDSKIEAVITEAIKAGMTRADVIRQLTERGIIK